MGTPETHRAFFAEYITAMVGTPKSRLTSAFAATPRERYLGPGPWKIFVGLGYLQTPSDDPSFLYQDVVVALEESRRINNGQPALHAVCLAALNVKEGETVVHIGAGTGYYTAILAELVGPQGKIFAYEIDPQLAERAATNLTDKANVTLYARSGAQDELPDCHAIYISAGATAPLDMWLNALRIGGRLLVPLTPDGAGEMPGAGAMLLVTRTAEEKFDARFVSAVMIIPCTGARDTEMAKKLAEAFRRGDAAKVASLRRNTPPDESCWCAGSGWWLSTSRNG